MVRHQPFHIQRLLQGNVTDPRYEHDGKEILNDNVEELIEDET